MLAACGRARRAQARAWFSGAGFGCRAQNKGRGPGGRRKQHLVLLGEAALLHDHGIEEELLEGALQNLLLNRLLSHEAVDNHGLCLANAVSAVHRLDVDLGVPVRVEEHHNVGLLQIETETTFKSTKNRKSTIAECGTCVQRTK